MAKCERCDKNEKLESFNRCAQCIRYGMSKADIIVSNILAYVNIHRHGGSRLKIHEACMKRFSDDDIESAKELLFKEYEYVLGTPQKRVGSRLRNKSDFNMEDIFVAFENLDKKNIEICCVSDNVKLLPKYDPEELALTSIVERILKLENKTEDHDKRLDEAYAREVKGNSDVEELKKGN